ncbi:MFS transporter [Phytoactinopolyspora mesophila]|uniref:MFS transporter n=1 Tax=Phytoactinopolyspora mesophila TaxID=2650750 RepID=UPI0031B57075
MRDPLLPPGFLGQPQRLSGLTGMFLAAAGSGVVNFVLAIYLQQVLDWSPLMTAISFLPFAIALIGVGQVAARIIARFGPIAVTAAGLLTAAAGLGLLVRIDHDTTYALGLVPGLVLVAIGIALAFSGSAVLSTADVPQRQAGLAGGVMNTAMELGPTVGLAALMAVAASQVDPVAGYGWAFGTAAVAFVGAALLMLLPTKTRRDRTQGGEPADTEIRHRQP